MVAYLPRLVAPAFLRTRRYAQVQSRTPDKP